MHAPPAVSGRYLYGEVVRAMLMYVGARMAGECTFVSLSINCDLFWNYFPSAGSLPYFLRILMSTSFAIHWCSPSENSRLSRSALNSLL